MFPDNGSDRIRGHYDNRHVYPQIPEQSREHRWLYGTSDQLRHNHIIVGRVFAPNDCSIIVFRLKFAGKYPPSNVCRGEHLHLI